MIKLKTLLEASYEGNMGVMELVKFFEIASSKEIQMYNKYVESDPDKVWKLVQKVTKTKLKGFPQ